MSNAEIAQRLIALAQMLQVKGENPFKVRAYRRAAQNLQAWDESVYDLVLNGADLTSVPGIGKGIAAALREIVFSGKLGQLEMLLTSVPPELAALNEYPRLDPRRAARVFKKLQITTVPELVEKFEQGAIGKSFGPRMEDHFRSAFRTPTQILLDDADILAARLERFLKAKCGVRRLEIAGEVRRRVEVVGEIAFLIATDDFPRTREAVTRFGGGVALLTSSVREATYQLPASVTLKVHAATEREWRTALVVLTGADAHLDELRKVGGLARRSRNEADVYTSAGLAWIPPELREGNGETALAARGALPVLVERADIRGDLHMHTTSSDGLNSVEEMAAAGRERGYEYIGITDHSQSLRIARGVSVANLWAQIRRIDKLNERGLDIRILKSAEVDILADGSLDYPDDVLNELDYTICSIHSRFRLGKTEQTERILRAMDHPSFNILGHATGRLLLKRSGYDIDLERIARHAKAVGCYFEINADPDRLDLSAEKVRQVAAAGVKIAICTDAHRASGLDYIQGGLDVARRAGLEKGTILNTLPWDQLRRALQR
jgi:DNA polymerase (family 10)